MLQGHRDLKVYQLAYRLAMEVFHLSKGVPSGRKVLSYGPNSAVFTQCSGKHCGRVSQAALSEHAY